MSTEQKRKELEAAGYELGIHTDGIVSSWTVELPDGTVLIKRFFFSDFDRANVESVVVRDAYEHLQREQKLKALEALIKYLADIKLETMGDEYRASMFIAVVSDARRLVKQYNITGESDRDE